MGSYQDFVWHDFLGFIVLLRDNVRTVCFESRIIVLIFIQVSIGYPRCCSLLYPRLAYLFLDCENCIVCLSTENPRYLLRKSRYSILDLHLDFQSNPGFHTFWIQDKWVRSWILHDMIPLDLSLCCVTIQELCTANPGWSFWYVPRSPEYPRYAIFCIQDWHDCYWNVKCAPIFFSMKIQDTLFENPGTAS